MKNKILLLGLVAIFTLRGISQDGSFRFGVKVAPNLAWITPDAKDYEKDGSVLGFSAGFVADIGLTENYFIKTGINYDYLNGKLKFPYKTSDDVVGEMSRKYNLRYIELPLTFKMRTNQFGDFAYFGELGVGTAFNVKAKSQDEFQPDGGGSVVNSDSDVNDEIVLIKETLIIGAGAEYFIDESTSLFIEFNFNAGLTNILDEYNSRYPDVKQKGKLSHIQLCIGVLF